MGGRPEALRLGLTLVDGMRVGLYGGSFDPVHAGHLHVAETASRRLGLDRVIWLVSPQSPLKGTPRPLAQRQEAARRQARGAMVVSDAEARLGSRYTVDTVRRLKRRFPRVNFVWIMGADSLAELHAWRDWRGLMRAVPVAVVARPGWTLKSLTSPGARRFAFARIPAIAARRLPTLKAPAWVYLPAPWNPLSSTALRQLRGLHDQGLGL